MRKIALLAMLTTILVLASTITQARTVSGITIPDRVQVAGHELVLNGAGTRTKFFFDIYVCALYLPKPAASTQAVLAEPGPRRILMHFVFHKVSRSQLVDGWNEGFEENTTKAERASLQQRIDAFDALFGDAPKGQEALLDFVPGKGTTVTIDGTLRGTIAGKDFNDALLRIWLGEHPATRSLKRAMLGKSS
jgi:hypothetical protein